MKNPKFQVFTDKSGKFHFHLLAKNGQIVLASQKYASKSNAMKGIESVKKNAADEGRFDRLESKAGQFYFNLKSPNSQIIVTSQMYKSKASSTNGIKAVMRDAPVSGVEDMTKEAS